MLHFVEKNCRPFLAEGEAERIEAQAEAARQTLLSGSGYGSDYLGWLRLPENYDREEFDRILKAAEKIRRDSQLLVVVGIGGSYLGARAVIDSLSSPFASLKKAAGGCQVVYAGNQMSASYLRELMSVLDDYEVSVNVISKSGTTTEPAIAFRILKNYMEQRYGREEAARRIYATTDQARGALLGLAKEEGYERFVVPDDVGGRYSVLTAVGLLPIAAAGLDIEALMAGAAEEARQLLNTGGLDNPALRYAVCRNLLHRRGYSTEILVNYEPALHYISEWWKQLYGESEGKDGKGIFPAAVDNSTDLHSMGQYIQDGRRQLFETVLRLREARDSYSIPEDPRNLDGLNFLAGMDLAKVNEKALEGTVLAHVDGGVPNMELQLEQLDERHLGALIYFFEFACGVSAYLNGINPFDQPGVEAYKRNMFALLGKPGYEEERKVLEARLNG